MILLREVLEMFGVLIVVCAVYGFLLWLHDEL